jgi:hypothetical protein
LAGYWFWVSYQIKFNLNIVLVYYTNRDELILGYRKISFIVHGHQFSWNMVISNDQGEVRQFWIRGNNGQGFFHVNKAHYRFFSQLPKTCFKSALYTYWKIRHVQPPVEKIWQSSSSHLAESISHLVESSSHLAESSRFLTGFQRVFFSNFREVFCGFIRVFVIMSSKEN